MDDGEAGMARLMTSAEAQVRWMRRHNIPVTRETYVGLAYGAEPPEPWTPQHEAKLPEELQDWSRFQVLKRDPAPLIARSGLAW
jgi:hypothetical protein